MPELSAVAPKLMGPARGWEKIDDRDPVDMQRANMLDGNDRAMCIATIDGRINDPLTVELAGYDRTVPLADGSLLKCPAQPHLRSPRLGTDHQSGSRTIEAMNGARPGQGIHRWRWRQVERECALQSSEPVAVRKQARWLDNYGEIVILEGDLYLTSERRWGKDGSRMERDPLTPFDESTGLYQRAV